MPPLQTLQEPLSTEEKKFYGSIFKTLDPKHTGLISGGVAKPLLEASGLPLVTLGEIWNISDSDNTGFLNQFSFCIAMRLIAHAQINNNDGVNLSTANYSAPLAKFQTIRVNNTGSGIPNHPIPPPVQPRITSTNSIQSNISNLSSNSNLNASNSKNLIVPILSPIQASSFGAMFDKTAVNNILPGNQAKNIFLKARLPVNILEQVWNLVDQNQNGQLTRPQFIIAMHLIQCFMNKSITSLPTVLSDQLWKVAESSSNSNLNSNSNANANSKSIQNPSLSSTPINTVSPSSSPSPLPSAKVSTNLNTWIMSSQQKQQYGAIFDTLDTEKNQYITSSTVANFLMTSKLSNQILASIWELANLDQSDTFTKQEFSIAMYLVQKTLAGYELPDSTPSELISSSQFNDQQSKPLPLPPHNQPPQSFATAKAIAAPQRTPSHMDDLLDIFQSASAMPPAAPAPRTTSSNSNNSNSFTPSSQFGRNLQYQQPVVAEENESSSSDDEGPENLDMPHNRGIPPPAIPGRANKPHFDDSTSNLNTGNANYDAIKNVNNGPSMFSNQPSATDMSALGGFTGTTASNTAVGMATAAGAIAGAGIGAGVGAITGGFSSSSTNNNHNFNDQMTQASVDIANYSNQIGSLSKQTGIVSGKKDKAQNELNKILKKKEEIAAKLSQLKALHEKETQQVIDVQNIMIKSKEENDSLENDLSIVEANYHAEQAKKEQLQSEYDESQKQNQLFKEKLGTLNAETNDLKLQFEELSGKVKQSSNMLAVTQQQVATQESTNNELKSKISELNNKLIQIETNHQSLLTKMDQLNDENIDLYQQHTDLSVKSANKSIEYSETLANAASKGVIDTDFVEDDNADVEVPTATLDDFDFDAPATNKSVIVDDKKADSKDGTNSSPVAAVDVIPVPSSPTTTTTDSTTMSNKESEITSPTPEGSTVAENTTAQQFSLPFDITHSETSSTQNNPSQSVRDDSSPISTSASTIEGTPEVHEDALSSQVLPEGTVVETGDNNSGESFEFVNHTTNNEAETIENDDNTVVTEKPRQTSVSGVSVETLSDSPHNENSHVNELDEFPPIQELEPLADDISSSSDDDDDDDHFEDAKAIKEDSRNPFGGNNNSKTGEELELKPAAVETGPSMFDDLNLEEAQVEDANAFDNNDGAFANSGFSVTNANVNDGLNNNNNNEEDDWEQVFEGFGNDPNLQPAAVEESGNNQYESNFQTAEAFGFGNGAVTDSSIPDGHGFSQSQRYAIDELLDMGFDEQDAIKALQSKGWNIDDASNYLLENA